MTISQKTKGTVGVELARTAEGGLYLRFKRLIDAVSYEESPLGALRGSLDHVEPVDWHGPKLGSVGVGMTFESGSTESYTPGHEFEQPLNRGDTFGVKISGPGPRVIVDHWAACCPPGDGDQAVHAGRHGPEVRHKERCLRGQPVGVR